MTEVGVADIARSFSAAVAASAALTRCASCSGPVADGSAITQLLKAAVIKRRIKPVIGCFLLKAISRL
jgi:hypothetical protein